MEARLGSELRLKAVDMLRSSRELCQSHAEDIALDYLWEGDEYGSLDSRLKEMEKNSVDGGQPEVLALTHVLERLIVVYFENQDKATEFVTTLRKKTDKDNKKEQGIMTYLGEFDVKFTPLVTLLLLGPGRVNGT